MKNLLDGKMIIVSTSDCELDFVLIINRKDYAATMNTVEQAKKEFFDYDNTVEFELLTDYVSEKLEVAGIEFIMPDFEEIGNIE